MSVTIVSVRVLDTLQPIIIHSEWREVFISSTYPNIKHCSDEDPRYPAAAFPCVLCKHAVSYCWPPLHIDHFGRFCNCGGEGNLNYPVSSS